MMCRGVSVCAVQVFLHAGPKTYEPCATIKHLHARVSDMLESYNEDFPSNRLELILFDDALRHVARIARILSQPQGSALLVGVGGSGKQSLTRLAAFLSSADVFTLSVSKTYNVASMLEDVRGVFRRLSQKCDNAVLLVTDNEIKDDTFLEYISQLLITGTIPGLFAKDEVRTVPRCSRCNRAYCSLWRCLVVTARRSRWPCRAVLLLFRCRS